MHSKPLRFLIPLALVAGLIFPPIIAFSQTVEIANNETIVLAKRRSFAGDIIFIRGGWNIFSAGMDQMSKKLAKRGIKSRVIQHSESANTAARIIKHQKRYGRKPVILIGHSLGANEVIRIAKILLRKRIRVNYMVVFAATNPDPIPRNVSRTVNYYFKTNGWGKPVTRGRGTRGRIRNIDLSNVTGVNHFNVEKSRKIQNRIIRNILRYVRSRGKV